MADTPPELGKLITKDELRDAIHVAVTPMKAATMLLPGQHVGITSEGTAAATVDKHIGVVDPFLRIPVPEGKRFWLFLYPNSIVALRHQWAHPDLPDEGTMPIDAEREIAERWMREYAEKAGVSYQAALDAGRDKIETGEGLRLPSDIPHSVYYGEEDDRLTEDGKLGEPRNLERYWRNFELLTGILVGDKDESPFWCSC